MCYLRLYCWISAIICICVKSLYVHLKSDCWPHNRTTLLAGIWFCSNASYRCGWNHWNVTLCCPGDIRQFMFTSRAAVSAIHWRPDSGAADWEANGSQLSGWNVAAGLSADWRPLAWHWALQSPVVGAVVHLSGHQRRVHYWQCTQSSVRVAATCCPPQKTPTRVRLTHYYQSTFCFIFIAQF